MKLSTKYLLFLLFSISTIVMVAQDQENDDDDDGSPRQGLIDGGPKKYYVFSPRLNVMVPHAIANNSFRKCFVGVYEASGGLNVFLYRGLFIGGSYENGELRITPKKIANYPNNNYPSMEIDNVAGKVGGDLYLGDRNRVVFSAALSFGQNWTHYYGLVAQDPHKVITNTSYTCTFYKPEVNLFFLVDDNFGIGVTVTYSVYDHIFNPYELSLNDWAGFSSISTGSTQYLSFGFGVYYSFIKKKH